MSDESIDYPQKDFWLSPEILSPEMAVQRYSMFVSLLSLLFTTYRFRWVKTTISLSSIPLFSLLSSSLVLSCVLVLCLLWLIYNKNDANQSSGHFTTASDMVSMCAFTVLEPLFPDNSDSFNVYSWLQNSNTVAFEQPTHLTRRGLKGQHIWLWQSVSTYTFSTLVVQRHIKPSFWL